MPLSHLLAAVDDSVAGRHAFEVARALAAENGVRLSTMTVLSSTGSVPEFLAPYSPFVGQGVAGIEIARKAEVEGVDLVILGRAQEESCRPRMGSTADAIVRRSRVPCFFVPSRQHVFSQAVMAVDGTERGMAILGRVQDLGLLGVEAVDVRMVEQGELDSAASSPPSGPRMRITNAMSALPTPGLTPSLTILHGDPVSTLLASVNDPSRTVLVVGARRGGPGGPDRSSGVGRVLLYDSPCAVLTMPI